IIHALAHEVRALKLWRLKVIASKGMVKGLDQIDHPNQVCEGCLLKKHARSTFPKEATSRANETLQLIHTDLCGPITPPSHGESKTRSLQELYKVTDETPLLCLYAHCEPLIFEEAMKRKKWRQAMDEEIKWVYNAKKNAKGEVEKYKARLVEKGYKQKHVIDYEEVYAHVARLETIRMLIAISAQEIHQMVAFLNGLSEKEVYVEQLEGYVAKGERRRLISYYLGIEVKQANVGIFLCQETYAKEILKRFDMEKCNPVCTPLEHKVEPSKNDGGEAVNSALFKQLVESLRYLTCTRPNILFAVGLISRFMEEPMTRHLKIAKRIFCYIKGDVRSTSEFLFFLRNNAFTWFSKKQPIVILSSCEAEYVASTSCICHTIWLKSMRKELHMKQEDATEIYVDNKSAIDLAKNPVYHDRRMGIRVILIPHFHIQRLEVSSFHGYSFFTCHCNYFLNAKHQPWRILNTLMAEMMQAMIYGVEKVCKSHTINFYVSMYCDQQRLPIWWRWYYWTNLVAWSLYGLLMSQYGDVNEPLKLVDDSRSVPLRQLLKDQFGYEHEFLGIGATAVVGFIFKARARNLVLTLKVYVKKLEEKSGVGFWFRHKAFCLKIHFDQIWE
nr:retrovirus-related Pol polyprotein from transposon TNT 1-94 [Tanacetum cinerariifolium]